MRDGFRAISSGWTLLPLDGLTECIEALAEWTKANGPLEPDEQATVTMMIESQIARGGWDGSGDDDYDPPRWDDDDDVA